MKIGVQVSAYDVNRFLIAMLENCGPHVDRIYATWSRHPWSAYNEDAPRTFQNSTPPDLIDQSGFREKVTFIRGEWPNEESQRNAALERARADGMDFLIVQDADEFYFAEGYQENLLAMTAQPDKPLFQTPWILFWKSVDYALEYREHAGVQNTIYATCPLFAVNVSGFPDLHFTSRRLTNYTYTPNSNAQLPATCYHLSWVLSDDEVLRKISTWGHSHQVDIPRWFHWKWLAWRPDTWYLGAIESAEINRAARFNGLLPEEIKSLTKPMQNFQPLSEMEALKCATVDCFSVAKLNLKAWKRRLTAKSQA